MLFFCAFQMGYCQAELAYCIVVFSALFYGGCNYETKFTVHISDIYSYVPRLKLHFQHQLFPNTKENLTMKK
jgi:hypothetical protein